MSNDAALSPLRAPVSRRAFLRAGAVAAGIAGLALESADAGESPPRFGRARRCILLMLTGGPSQLETWDPKPDAPAEIRGPFAAIATSAAGIRISEHLPRTASLAHRLAILRTIHHDAPPIHVAGQQLLQTGRLSSTSAFPHLGAVLARHKGPARAGAAPFVLLPTPLGNNGMALDAGQGAAFLGADAAPRLESHFIHRLSPTDRDRYGKSGFGDACVRARQLVEAGTSCVVVNMFETVYDRVTWDCHADRNCLASTLDDYSHMLCPAFDRAFASLLEDLRESGILDETLVVAMGEFGRSPRLNAQGGRDHWPACWSIVMAGGGVRGGQAIGASDRHAAEPATRPISCAEVTASIYHAMGLPLSTQLTLPDRRAIPLIEAVPIRELFG